MRKNNTLIIKLDEGEVMFKLFGLFVNQARNLLIEEGVQGVPKTMPPKLKLVKLTTRSYFIQTRVRIC